MNFCIVKLLIIFSLLFISSTGVHALTVRGQTLSPIIYEPDKIITNHYTIEGTSLPVEVSLSGELALYASITPIVSNQFDLIITFPNEVLSPGTHFFSLLVKETPSGHSGIGSTTLVSKVFTVEVYPNEKEIEASLSIPNVNVNDLVNFQLNIRSRSYQNITSVRGKVEIYNFSNTPIISILTPEKPLPRLSTVTLEGTYDKYLPPGDYLAKAVIFYDGKEKKVDSNFKVGSMNIKLLNYTQIFELEFSEFKIHIVNSWGNRINSVYAQLIIDGKVKLQTPTHSLDPWQESELSSIMKVDLPPGTYDGIIKLFFDGNEKEEKIILTVKELVNNAKTNGATLIYVSYGMIIGIALILLLFVLRKMYLKKLGKEMRFNKLYLFFIIGIATFLAYNLFIVEKEIKCDKIDELNASLTVKIGVMGFNTEKDSLKFGKVSPGETVKRSVIVSYTKDVRIIVTMVGDLSLWTEVTPNEFSLSANNTQEVYFEVAPPKSVAEGNYTGKAKFCYIEQ